MLIEVAVENLESAMAAVVCGARRIELCSELGKGGVTPNGELLRAVRARVEVPLQVLIRPRVGGFVYGMDEVATMVADIRAARRSGADGVVLGALTGTGEIDRELTARLVDEARPLQVTFHRAVDQTPDLGASVATLVELGFDRVLTSGGAETAESGITALARLVRHFGVSLTILAGGRVRPGNARRICRESGVKELHLGPLLPGTGNLDTAVLGAVMQELATAH